MSTDSVTWKGFTFNTATHPASPTASQPGLAPGYNQWMPENVSVANENLQLTIQRNSKLHWQGQVVWAAAEAVLEQPVNYGIYYVTFKVTDKDGTPNWGIYDIDNGDKVDINSIFGVFLYDAQGVNSGNPNCEIDFLELGFQGQPNNGSGWIGSQPNGPALNNAQFAVQPWDLDSPNAPNFDMVHRIALDVKKIPSTGEVTIACNYADGATPVKNYLAYGPYDSSNFPFDGADTISYTTPSSQKAYVPELNDNMRLHINLWPYGGPSTNDPVYVQVTNLEVPS
ncbi:MAG: hypothetical protein ACFB10_09610 [Salibacteraceae bacterium]